jgi:hypothetical protein
MAPSHSAIGYWGQVIYKILYLALRTENLSCKKVIIQDLTSVLHQNWEFITADDDINKAAAETREYCKRGFPVYGAEFDKR